jgi:hypothetical protein
VNDSVSRLKVNGGTLSAGHNVSIFVNGDAYISSNISYADNWPAGNAPSFILHATGNIYIDPGVTKLAGVYIAQDKSDGSKGKIYTCADTSNHFSPMQASNLYSDCNNQLVVTGSFVAKQVNLMRTFGSLRDEEPNPGSPGGTPIVPLTWSSCGAAGAGLAGESCPDSTTLASLRCTITNEPSDSHGWSDNKICVPSSSSVHLYWTHCATFAGCDQSAGSIASDPGALHLNNVKNGIGTAGGRKYPYCEQAYAAGDPDTWDDNWLCSDQNIGLKFSGGGGPGCIKVNEVADPDANWRSGYYVCVNTTDPTGPTPKGPPFTCINQGIVADPAAAGGLGGRPVLRRSVFAGGVVVTDRGTRAATCAGEVFLHSPVLYLSHPVVQPPGNGSIQFQSITSLPPVL